MRKIILGIIFLSIFNIFSIDTPLSIEEWADFIVLQISNNVLRSSSSRYFFVQWALDQGAIVNDKVDMRFFEMGLKKKRLGVSCGFNGSTSLFVFNKLYGNFSEIRRMKKGRELRKFSLIITYQDIVHYWLMSSSLSQEATSALFEKSPWILNLMQNKISQKPAEELHLSSPSDWNIYKCSFCGAYMSESERDAHFSSHLVAP